MLRLKRLVIAATIATTLVFLLLFARIGDVQLFSVCACRINQYFILTSVHTKVILDKKEKEKKKVNTELDLDKNIHPHSPIHLLRTNIIKSYNIQDYELSICNRNDNIRVIRNIYYTIRPT